MQLGTPCSVFWHTMLLTRLIVVMSYETFDCCRFVLTQFNSNALNTHIHTCYPPGGSAMRLIHGEASPAVWHHVG